MKLVYESDNALFYADDDKYLIKVPTNHEGKPVWDLEETVTGECACSGCNTNRDWRQYEAM